MEGLRARKQVAPHDPLGIGVLAALRATCSSSRLRAHSPVWFPCQPAPFKKPCSHPPVACFPATATTIDCGRCFEGSVAMSSLRKLDADRPQTYCLRTLLFMRTTRYLLIQSQTIVSVPCFLARLPSCVSGHRFRALNPSSCRSRPLVSVILSLFGPYQPAFRRTPKLVPSWNSTKRRLNLHTRHAPPAASF